MLQCIKYAAFVTDLGDTPYRLAEPILARVSPEQLRQIELTCPEIMSMSDGLWREHIKRKFKDRKLPDGQFRDTYDKYCEDKEAQLVAARERLKLKQQQYTLYKKASAVVALSEAEMPLAQRGPPQISFKSRSMQSVAKRMQSTSAMRKAPLPKFAKLESRGLSSKQPEHFSPARDINRASVPERIAPLAIPPLAPPPLRAGAPIESRAASPPAPITPSHSPVSSLPQTQQPTSAPASFARRKRVSPLFHPRRT